MPRHRLRIRDVLLDTERYVLTVRATKIHLTPTAFKMLERLMHNAGKVVTHNTLLRRIWGPEYAVDSHLLRVCIGRLRAKIEEYAEQPTYTVTELGVGYRFRDTI